MRKWLFILICVTLISSYAHSYPIVEFAPDADTVALWHLNGNGLDESGNGNNLTIKTDRVFWENSPLIQCARMGIDPWGGAGTDCFLSDGSALTTPGAGCTYPGSGDWTIEAWVKFPTNDKTYFAIAHYSEHWAAHDPYFLDIRNGVAEFQINNSVTVSTDVSSLVGQWIHIAGVYRYGESMEIYVNGHHRATETTTAIIEYLPNYNGSLGGVFCGTSTDLLIDEVRISNIARYSELSQPNIVTPNGGEELAAGQDTVINWESSPNIANVSIEFSDDAGTTWMTIDPNTPDDGEYEWVVAQATSDQCLIRISDITDPSVYDTSDYFFTIFECQMNLLSDLNNDCMVNLSDFAIMASEWLLYGNPYSESCGYFMPDEHTLALWRLNGNGLDASGNENHLAVKDQYVSWIYGPYCFGLEMGVFDWDPSTCFNSNGAALTAPGTSCNYSGTGDYTVEAWIRFPSLDTNYTVISHYSEHWAGHDPLGLVVNSGVLRFWINNDTEDDRNVEADISSYVGEWIHVAGVYRYQQDLSIYLNGQLLDVQPTTEVIEVLTSPSYELTVGGNHCAISTDLQIDEVRISDTARYSGCREFVPDADTVALWHLDGNGDDASGNGNDLAIKTDRVFFDAGDFCGQYATLGTDPWGGAGTDCFLSDGAAMTAPGTSCNYSGTGDYTVEAWIRFPSLDSNYTVISHYSEHWAGHDPLGLVVSSGVLRFWINNDTSDDKNVEADISNYVGEWIHVAGVYRYQQDLSIYLNGQLLDVQPTTEVIEVLTQSQYEVTVGGHHCATATDLQIDEVRISNIAR